MTIRCNAGTATTDLVGDLPEYGTVWFDPHGITNILSLKRVKAKYRVQYDSGNATAVVVTKPDGKQFQFREDELGLHYLDTNVYGIVLINTVAGNKASYTKGDYKRAQLARDIQIKIGRPSTKDFIRIVDNNLLVNCPITCQDIITAERMFGLEVGALKGKTTRAPPSTVKGMVNLVPIEPQYCAVTLCGDIMFVNGIAFLVTISRNIKFGTIKAIPNQTMATLLKGIQKVMQLYKCGGFKIVMTLTDGQFEPLRGDLAGWGITLNEAARDEHVGEIEHYIQTIKERMRSAYSMLPFQMVPS